MILRLAIASMLMASFLAIAGCRPSSGEPAPVRPAQSPAPATATPPAPSGQATGGIGAPRIQWAQKTHAQRLDYMGLYVLPTMENLFKSWRPDDYADMRCQTCHGESFDKPPVNYHMPSVSYPLRADDPIGGAMKYDPEATRFMVEKVLPTMAGLLKEKAFDPGTGKGFSCFRCHPTAEKKQP